MSSFVAILDANGTIEDVNQAPCLMAGRRREDVIGRTLWDTSWWIGDGAAQHRLKTAFQKALAGKSVRYDEWLQLPEERVAVDLTLARILDDVEVRVVASAIDVTDRVVAQRREREQREELEAIMKAVPAAIWIAKDRSCTRITGNPESYRLLRMSAGQNASASASGPEKAARSFKEFRDGAPLSPEELPMQRAARDGVEVCNSVLDLVFDDGEIRHALGNAAPLRDDDGTVRGAVAAFIDVTALRQAQDAMREREREFRLMADNSPDIYSRFDRQLRHVFVNAAVERATGIPPSAFIGKTNRELGMPEDDCIRWEQATLEVFESGEPQTISFSFEDQRGPRVYSARLVPERLESGEVRSVLVVATDVTEQRRAEQTLAEANQRKDEFIATLAHELRNPLAPMRSGFELLRQFEPSKKTDRVLWMMQRQLSHMVRLIDDLLDISRITSGKISLHNETFGIQDAIELALEATAPAIQEGNHTLDVHVPKQPLLINGDLARVTQIVSNLINNAAKYTAPGGTITVSAEVDDGRACLAVRDTGLGIPEEMLQSIFDMFTQVNRTLHRSQGGLGIGLALVKRLVELHGGAITAESPGLGQGSLFKVHFPLSLATHVASSFPLSNTPSQISTRLRILVVDDNEDAAEMMCMLIENGGHDPRAAKNGAEAVMVAQEHVPQLIFLDLGLPDMDGFEVMRRLRRLQDVSGVTVVALTGWGDEAMQARTKSEGFAQHMTKPVDTNHLLQVIAEVASAHANP